MHILNILIDFTSYVLKPMSCIAMPKKCKPTYIINAKVYEYGSLLFFHAKTTEEIGMNFGIEIDHGLARITHRPLVPRNVSETFGRY